jgi:hypothetical protein
MEKNYVGNLTRLLFKNRTETDLRELLILLLVRTIQICYKQNSHPYV